MAGPACVACGSDARPSSRVAYERILSPYSISAEPPPLRPGIGQRHGVSSRNGRHWPKLRQHFPPARGRPSGMGLDVDRLPGAGPALCGADAAQVTGFTLAAGLVLATGIGMNVTAFGLFDMMVLKPLPVRDPGTILQFHRRSSKGSATLVAYPAMAFYGEHSTKLSAVMATSGGGLTFENDASPIGVRFVTANFFTELGAGAALGRVLNLVWDD